MEDVERLHKGLIGRQCPVCQTVMLTAEDYRIARRIQWKLSLLAFFSRFFTRMYPQAGMGTMSVHVKDGELFSEFQRDQHL